MLNSVCTMQCTPKWTLAVFNITLPHCLARDATAQGKLYYGRQAFSLHTDLADVMRYTAFPPRLTFRERERERVSGREREREERERERPEICLHQTFMRRDQSKASKCRVAGRWRKENPRFESRNERAKNIPVLWWDTTLNFQKSNCIIALQRNAANAHFFKCNSSTATYCSKCDSLNLQAHWWALNSLKLVFS